MKMKKIPINVIKNTQIHLEIDVEQNSSFKMNKCFFQYDMGEKI